LLSQIQAFRQKDQEKDDGKGNANPRAMMPKAKGTKNDDKTNSNLLSSDLSPKPCEVKVDSPRNVSKPMHDFMDFMKVFPTHVGVECDGCTMNPIFGTRYRAENIPDFDLCDNCHEFLKNDNITFEVIETPRKRCNGKTCAPPKKTPKSESFNLDPNFMHGRHTCDGCLKSPIIGLRYYAINLKDYDLCTDCFLKYDGNDIVFEAVELERDRKHQLNWKNKYDFEAKVWKKKLKEDLSPHCNPELGSVNSDGKKNINKVVSTCGFKDCSGKVVIPQENEKNVTNINIPSPAKAHTKNIENESINAPLIEIKEVDTPPKQSKVNTTAAREIDSKADYALLGEETKRTKGEEVDGDIKSNGNANGEKIMNEEEVVGDIKSKPDKNEEEIMFHQELPKDDLMEEFSTGSDIPEAKQDKNVEMVETFGKEEEILSGTDDEIADGWDIVSEESDQIRSDEMLARAAQMVGSALFEEDVNRPTPETDISLTLLTRWSDELQRLRELGFTDDKMSIEVLEKLEAANIGVDSTDPVKIENVVDKLLQKSY